MVDAASELDRIQVDLIRALASPLRLRILHALGDGPMEVSQLARRLQASAPTVSQNLAAMRSVGLLDATRDGRAVRYRVADPEILAACSLMRDVILRRLTALGSLAAADSDARSVDHNSVPVDAPLQVTTA